MVPLVDYDRKLQTIVRFLAQHRLGSLLLLGYNRPGGDSMNHLRRNESMMSNSIKEVTAISSIRLWAVLSLDKSYRSERIYYRSYRMSLRGYYRADRKTCWGEIRRM